LIILLVLIGILALIVTIGAIWLSARIEGSIHTIGDPFSALPGRPPRQDPAAPAEASGQRATNILILGSDSRISAGDPSQWQYGAQRTDAIILAHIPGEARGATLVSIPRDSWVEIPGHGMAKVNAAFSYGGPSLMIQTVEQLTGVRIDHFAVADFDSFVRLTNAVGGVRIGSQVLNGEQALAYTRQRYGLPGGDFDRIKRQQNWVRALASSAADVGREPKQVLELVSAVSGALAVDDGLTLKKLIGLAMDMRGTNPKDLVFVTVPVKGTGWSPDGTQSIVRLNKHADEELFQALAQDRASAYIAENADELDILGANAP